MSDPIKPPDTLEEATAHVQYLVIQAVQGYLGRLETSGRITGNSHHMAQRLATQAAQEVTERWRNP